MPTTALKKYEKSYEPVIAKEVYANQFETLDEDYFYGSSKSQTSSPKRLNTWEIITDLTNITNKEENEDNVVFLNFEEKQNPITQNDTISSNDNEAQKLIFRLKTTTRISNNIGIANRLLELFDFSKDEEPEFIGINAESLKSFYYYLRTYTKIKRPAITLTPNNEIYASWREDGGRVFSIHFLADSNVRFVIFTPNRRRPDRKTRASGTTTYDMLMETEAVAYKLYSWISQ